MYRASIVCKKWGQRSLTQVDISRHPPKYTYLAIWRPVLPGNSPPLLPSPCGDPNVYTMMILGSWLMFHLRDPHPMNVLALNWFKLEWSWRCDAGPISGQENTKREKERDCRRRKRLAGDDIEVAGHSRYNSWCLEIMQEAWVWGLS